MRQRAEVDKKIVLINGPPRAGKDTLADRLSDHLIGVAVDRFSAPLKAMAQALVGRSGDDLEAIKDDVLPELGVSYRNVQQDASEKFAKLLYGRDVFGRLLAARILGMNGHVRVVAVPDSGFVEELPPIASTFGVDRCFIVRVHRRGRTFEGDTREWVNYPGVDAVDVQNDGTPGELYSALSAFELWREFLAR